MFFIPGFAASAIKAAGALLDVIRSNPWQAAVLALLALFAWAMHGKHAAQAEVTAVQQQIAALKVEQQKAPTDAAPPPPAMDGDKQD